MISTIDMIGMKEMIGMKGLKEGIGILRIVVEVFLMKEDNHMGQDRQEEV